MTFAATSRVLAQLLVLMLAGGPLVAESMIHDSVGIPAPALEAQPRRLFTLIDYFESGRRALDAFVSAQDREHNLAAVIRRAKRACVRIEIRHHHKDEGYQSVNASGVVVDGGRLLLTAGHPLEGAPDMEVLVTLASGETRRARMLDREYEVYGGASRDWALLEILGPPLKSAPPVWIGEIREGEMALVLGYPDQIGINASGQVAYDSTEEGGYLEPLGTLGVVGRSKPLALTPQVGAIPMGGMSGGPVFDRRGGLIGIFVSLGKEASGENTSFLYNAAPVSGLLDRLQPHTSKVEPQGPGVQAWR